LLDTYFAERQPIGAQVLDWSRAQVGVMRPSRSSRALEAILRDLIETPDGATYFAERVWGATLRYELGTGHPLVGRSTPDFRFKEGVTVGHRLRSGKGLPLVAIASRWPGQIAYVAGEVEDRLGLRAVLVRPDGVVAWAGADAFDEVELARACVRWFGQVRTD
jgi:hypothetical protein